MREVAVSLFMLCSLTWWVFDVSNVNLPNHVEDYEYSRQLREVPEEAMVDHP